MVGGDQQSDQRSDRAERKMGCGTSQGMGLKSRFDELRKKNRHDVDPKLRFSQ